MVVAVVILLSGWILAVRHGTNRTGKTLSIFLIYWYDRRPLQRVFHGRAVYLSGVGDREVLTHCDDLVQIPRSVQSSGDILEISIFQDTIHVLVS